MSLHQMPAAEFPVSVDLVHRLLVDQHPDIAGLGIEVLAHGWDDMIRRLGDAHLVRLPGRALAAELVAHEQRWSRGLAAHLPLPWMRTPGRGRAGGRSPCHWCS